ncbi:unnamed protein product, partial [Urochloa humidicola]
GEEGYQEGDVNATQLIQESEPVPDEQPANPELEGNPLAEVAATPWPYQLPPGWTIEWDSTDAE